MTKNFSFLTLKLACLCFKNLYIKPLLHEIEARIADAAASWQLTRGALAELDDMIAFMQKQGVMPWSSGDEPGTEAAQEATDAAGAPGPGLVEPSIKPRTLREYAQVVCA